MLNLDKKRAASMTRCYDSIVSLQSVAAHYE